MLPLAFPLSMTVVVSLLVLMTRQVNLLPIRSPALSLPCRKLIPLMNERVVLKFWVKKQGSWAAFILLQLFCLEVVHRVLFFIYIS